MNFKNLMTKTQTTDFFIACKESRIENNTNFYGCFYLGPFDDSLTQTLANDLRRTLLSELTGLAITSVEIEGVLHKFSSLQGMKESVLDLICNLQNIVLKKQEVSLSAQGKHIKLRQTKKTYTGFLNISGPCAVKAGDLKLPSGLLCVDPNQYIATLAEDGFLNMKFNINEGKNFIKQKPHNLDVSVLKKRNLLLQNFKKTQLTNNVKEFTRFPSSHPPTVDRSTEGSGNAQPQPSVFHLGLRSTEGKTENGRRDKAKKSFFKTVSKFSVFGSLAQNEGRNTKEISINRIVPISNPIPLDAVFMPVTKINCIIEENNIYSDFNTDPADFSNKIVERTTNVSGSSNQLTKLQYGNFSSFLNTIDYNLIYQTYLVLQKKQPVMLSTASKDVVNLSTSSVFPSPPQGDVKNRGLRFTSRPISSSRPPSIFDPRFPSGKTGEVDRSTEGLGDLDGANRVKLVPWQSNTLYFDLSDTTQELTDNQAKELSGLPSPQLYSSFSKIKNFLAGQNNLTVKQQLITKNRFLFPFGMVTLLPKIALQSNMVGRVGETLEKQKTKGIEKNRIRFPNGRVFPAPLVDLSTVGGREDGNRGPETTLKTILKKQTKTFKINPVNGINQQNIHLEYAKNFKLKPIRKKAHLIVEIWTNGSLHPRQALYQSFVFLSNHFLKLQTVKMLGSMFKSELAYGNLKYSILNNYNLSKTNKNISSFYPPTGDRIYSPSTLGGEVDRLSIPFPVFPEPSVDLSTSPSKMDGGREDGNRGAKVDGNSKNGLEEINLRTDFVSLKNNKSQIYTSLNEIPFYIEASLKAPVGILNISLRAYTALKKANIFTLNDLIKYSKNDLLKIKNLGTKSLCEIETSLSYLGLTFKN